MKNPILEDILGTINKVGVPVDFKIDTSLKYKISAFNSYCTEIL